MSDDNPYRAPAAAGPKQDRRRPLGPVLSGLVAIVLATILAGGTGLLASLAAVGSWWAYKFWLRPAAPEVPGARDYLQRLEGSGSELASPSSAEPDGAAPTSRAAMSCEGSGSDRGAVSHRATAEPTARCPGWRVRLGSRPVR